ncbi:MAG: lipid II:glycine glycyltransferase FemX, partial [Spirochaetaceae bacterium]
KRAEPSEPLRLEEIAPADLPLARTFLQSAFWAELKSRFGWRPYAFILDNTEPLLLLHRSFAAGFSIAYIPHGLGHWEGEETAVRNKKLSLLSHSLSKKLPWKTLFLRYDLPWEKTASAESLPAALRRAPADIQPPSTVLLSLEGSEDELLLGMKRKTRYNIRLAGKRGVTSAVHDAAEVLQGEEDPLSRWYRLYEETAERDGIAIHSREYYRSLFSLAENRLAESPLTESQGEEKNMPKLFMVTAEHGGDLLAGIIVSLYGDTATYMYGAGSNYKRNLMGSYAVQWEAIRLAKRLGVSFYDFFGIPPADDPSHPMYGLYRFKTGFGGRIIHRIGSMDYPISPSGYFFYRKAEKLRWFYYKKLKKR